LPAERRSGRVSFDRSLRSSTYVLFSEQERGKQGAALGFLTTTAGAALLGCGKGAKGGAADGGEADGGAASASGAAVTLLDVSRARPRGVLRVELEMLDGGDPLTAEVARASLDGAAGARWAAGDEIRCSHAR
jgi:hypothetical protein